MGVKAKQKVDVFKEASVKKYICLPLCLWAYDQLLGQTDCLLCLRYLNERAEHVDSLPQELAMSPRIPKFPRYLSQALDNLAWVE